MQNGRKKAAPARGESERPTARLPAVSRLLDDPATRALVGRYGVGLVTALAREELETLRAAILAGNLAGEGLERAITPAALVGAIECRAASLLAARPRRVINATGVVVHTNLGRATLSARAAEQVAAAACGYLDLEYDVATGGRGDRLAALAPLMTRLFPGTGFAAFNNNAAAVLIALRALAHGREVLVSRGELVEIGGSFRIPDILAASGARLVEVGTTNRTRLADYERACSGETALVLKVHTSNFRVVGFAEEAPLGELSAWARRAGVPLVVDWGSGDLVDLEPLGIRDELPVLHVLREGADLVSFSADKLLGGPQAGLVVGDPSLVARLRAEPLARACRLDRLRLGALRETLVPYVTGRMFEEIPTLRMLALEPDEIGRRAARVRDEVARRTGSAWGIELTDGVSRTGGGSSPTGERPTRLLALAPKAGDAGGLERRLRLGEPPIIGRLQEGRLLLDLRTVAAEEEPTLVERLVEALAEEIRR